MRFRSWILVRLTILLSVSSADAFPQTLEKTLQEEAVESLVQNARLFGDARRGAIVFHQPMMACSRCHDLSGTHQKRLGPDLALWKNKATDEEIVEAILFPSKVIRRGYESIQVVTAEGRVITGLLHSDQNQVLTLRDPASGRLISLEVDSVVERRQVTTSIMPAGQVNQLNSREQFLDLVKFLLEVRDGGVDRATELRPPPSMFALSVPEYESRVDHAGLIRDLNQESFKRGETIYRRLCINCHGSRHHPGSLPTAMRFAEGRFRNGSDPYAIYRTLTHGFGFMVAQTWMVPQQKYDVVHYIREHYLRPYNPSQYTGISENYLTQLPAGDTRGPQPAAMDRWATMDYGPRLINTYEVGSDGSNFAYKGIAVRLDPGPGGVARGSAWMIFDHDTMRMAAAWTADNENPENRFVDWNGIHFNGAHKIHPRIVGELHVSNSTGPGWADPESGQLADTDRVIGRDGRRYGPLPRSWAQYHGLFAVGHRTILSYSVGSTHILEMPGLSVSSGSTSTAADRTEFTRTFMVGPRQKSLTLVVGDATNDGVLRTGQLISDTLIAPHPDLAPAIPGARGGEETNQKPINLPIRSAAGRVVRLAPQPSSTGAVECQKDGELRRHVDAGVMAGLSSVIPGATWSKRGRRLCLTLPAGDNLLNFVLWFARADDASAEPPLLESTPDLESVKSASPALWKEKLTTKITQGDAGGAFEVDDLTPPENNPWLAQTRLTGLDFFADGDALATCSWDGDVWLVHGLRHNAELSTLTWHRVASGLFQPLGLKIIDGRIFVTCRDQIVVLEDHNNDGETDFYRCFNNDHQVTEHFHEFAMGLQSDDSGNLYYAKSARHAKTAIVPHHGTLLRVSADGERTDILATGFRAANGVCLNPDGSFVVTDQEGHWNPKNRINWVREGGFYGNMFGYHDVTDSSDEAMEPPLCWITNAFDRSPGELLWIDSKAWGPLNGSLLNLSYGYGKVYVVPFETLDGQPQGGMCELPIAQFPTGTMRGRFNAADGHLYVCGMFAWAGNRSHPGGLYRIRATGKPALLPTGLKAHTDGISIEFTDALDVPSARNPENYRIKVWSLRRTASYGSEHYNEHSLEVTAAAVSEDGRTVTLTVPRIAPTWCMEIRCQVRTPGGLSQDRVIHNTIHRLND